MLQFSNTGLDSVSTLCYSEFVPTHTTMREPRLRMPFTGEHRHLPMLLAEIQATWVHNPWLLMGPQWEKSDVATSPVPSRRPKFWAEWLHNPYQLGGPQC